MKIKVLTILSLLMMAILRVGAAGLRSSRSPSILCRILLVDSLDGPGLSNTSTVEEDQEFKCILKNHTMSYVLDLPMDFVNKHPHCRKRHVAITNARPVWDRENMMPPSIALSPDSTFTMVNPSDDEGLHRHLESRESRSHGNKTILILRITSPDGEVEVTKERLSEVAFGSANFSGVAQQYRACSYNKLNFIPAQGTDVVNGVLEMNITSNVVDVNPEYLEPIIAEQAEAMLGIPSLDDAFDFIMFVVPYGTRRKGCCQKWYGFADIGGKRSFYNNENAGYASIVMHELGHNLGLQHSGENGYPYGDVTGIMGSSTQSYRTPRKCFNAHKNWLLGWYSDRTVDVNITEGPWTGNIIGLTQYKKMLGPYDYMVVKVGDIYMQYNRAWDFNLHTNQDPNKVLVVHGPSPDEYSDLLGDISNIGGANGHPYWPAEYRRENFQGTGSTLIIKSCEQNYQSRENGALPDIIRVGLHLDDGVQMSGCDLALPPPTLSPTPSPTQMPLPSPTPAPTDQPSDAPSVRPSEVPSASPSSSPSSMPSLSPTQMPSVSPSVLPSTFPSAPPSVMEVCTGIDEPGLVPVSHQLGNQTCQWISERKAWNKFLCREGYEAFEQCQETCDSCNRRKGPATNDTCEDSRKMFYVNDALGDRRCFWLGMFLERQRSPRWKERLCAPDQPAYDHCPETCGKCSDMCEDEPDVPFFINHRHGNQDCAWLADRPMWQAILCRGQGHDAYKYCRETCDSC